MRLEAKRFISGQGSFDKIFLDLWSLSPNFVWQTNTGTPCITLSINKVINWNHAKNLQPSLFKASLEETSLRRLARGFETVQNTAQTFYSRAIAPLFSLGDTIVAANPRSSVQALYVYFRFKKMKLSLGKDANGKQTLYFWHCKSTISLSPAPSAAGEGVRGGDGNTGLWYVNEQPRHPSGHT